MDRLAGSVLQYRQDCRHGWPRLSGGRLHQALRGDYRLDGDHAHHRRHHVRPGPLPHLHPPRHVQCHQRGGQKPRGGPARAVERLCRLLQEEAYRLLPVLHHPLSLLRGIRDEDRAALPQGTTHGAGPGTERAGDRPLLRYVRSGSLRHRKHPGRLLYRPSRTAEESLPTRPGVSTCPSWPTLSSPSTSRRASCLLDRPSRWNTSAMDSALSD